MIYVFRTQAIADLKIRKIRYALPTKPLREKCDAVFEVQFLK